MKAERFLVIPLIKESIESVSNDKVMRCVSNGLACVFK